MIVYIPYIINEAVKQVVDRPTDIIWYALNK